MVRRNHLPVTNALRNQLLLFLLGCVLLYGPPSRGEEAASGKGGAGRITVPTSALFSMTGAPGSAFRQPTDVAVDSRLQFYVLDGLNGRVVIFDGQGSYLRSFGNIGSGPGQLLMAVGIGISSNGEIFVADTGNHRIQVFSPDGSPVRFFSLKTGENADPTDVLLSPLQNLCYVCDNDNHQIQVYDAGTGRLRMRWGGYGKNLGEFRYPATLASDDRNQIYVVDVLNARVQTFDARGEGAREVAGWGLGLGRVFRPKGVALDKERRIFVSDSYMGLIKIFDNSGELAGVIGDEAGTMRKFASPTNLLIDAQERLVVVETRASRVSVLRVIH